MNFPTDAELADMIMRASGLSQGGEVVKPMNVKTLRAEVVEDGLPDPIGAVPYEQPVTPVAPQPKLMVGGNQSQAWDRSH